MLTLTILGGVVATVPLILILGYVVKEGASSLHVSFFTQTPKPPGEPGGGMGNAILGSLILIGIASLTGLPVGIGAGLYLAERRSTLLARSVRFLADVLNGLPSIMMGIVAWELLVRPVHHFSAFAGGMALGAMMIPMLARTTEEMVRLVPVSLREAAQALGYSSWRASITIVLRTALGGILTGALVAVARIAGETAPLLFTALGNTFWSTSLNAPIAALPLQVFEYATGPYDEWHTLAWAGAIVLVGLVLVIGIITRIVVRRPRGAGD
jgi:phosphate transport system permease protein